MPDGSAHAPFRRQAVDVWRQEVTGAAGGHRCVWRQEVTRWYQSLVCVVPEAPTQIPAFRRPLIPAECWSMNAGIVFREVVMMWYCWHSLAQLICRLMWDILLNPATPPGLHCSHCMRQAPEASSQTSKHVQCTHTTRQLQPPRSRRPKRKPNSGRSRAQNTRYTLGGIVCTRC